MYFISKGNIRDHEHLLLSWHSFLAISLINQTLKIAQMTLSRRCPESTSIRGTFSLHNSVCSLHSCQKIVQVSPLVNGDVRKQDFPSRVVPSIIGTTGILSLILTEKIVIKSGMDFLSQNVYSKKVYSPINLLQSR